MGNLWNSQNIQSVKGNILFIFQQNKDRDNKPSNGMKLLMFSFIIVNLPVIFQSVDVSH